MQIVGCDSKHCIVKYTDFESDKTAPFIYITNEIRNCVFSYKGQFWFEGEAIISDGEMFFEDDSILLTINAIKSSKIKFFDFSKDIGEEYKVLFCPKNSILKTDVAFQVTIEEIFTTTNGVEIFMYRMHKAFVLDDVASDIVFFVSREKGIIGSYISDFDNGVELVISPRGDILKNVIDYSHKEYKKIL
jgi:hypothetical protein